MMLFFKLESNTSITEALGQYFTLLISNRTVHGAVRDQLAFKKNAVDFKN